MIDTKLLRQKILDLAIRGKLVPQDLTDEPASELLKKIKAEKDALVKAGKIKKDKHESHIFKGDDNRYYETIDGKTADITDEIPFDLPDSWVWCRLGTLCDYGVCQSASPDEISADSWVLDLEDIEKDTGTLLQRIKKCHRPTTSNKHIFKVGNVLYSKLRTYLNKVLIADTDGYCTSEILPLDFGEYILAVYARHVLMSKMFLDYTAQCGYGVKMPRLGTSDGRKALFPIPPLAEQQRIVEQIETLLGYVDIIDADAETLEKSIILAKQKILDLAIRGKLVPQDPADEPASELLKKIKAEKDTLVKAGKLKKDKHESYIFKSDDNCYYEQLNGKTTDITVGIPFDLPVSWCWCRLKNIIDLLSGRDLTPQNYNDKGGRYPYITGASNFDKSKLIINRWTDAPEVISIPNDVLLTCKGTIGEITINSVGEIHIARQIMALRPSPSIIKEYLATVLQSMINHIKSEANGLIPGISRDVILELLIPIPPLAEQQRIVQAIAQYNSILELISK